LEEATMRVHELHAAAVHAPLALLPTAATVDLMAAITGNRSHARLGRALWWIGAGSGLLAGLAGAAASQEIRAEDDSTADMIWIHGLGNAALLAGALGLAAWRTGRRPTVLVSVLGLTASAASLYTAYLGGEMVYGRGVGVGSMPGYLDAGVGDSPPVLSKRAPSTFLRDAVAGLRWLFQRTTQAARGLRPVSRESFGLPAREVMPYNNV
jgi:uncharacterized membrane protein